jgi:hypothetical protein
MGKSRPGGQTKRSYLMGIPIGAISVGIRVLRNQKSAAIAFRDCNHFKKALKSYCL